MAPCVILMLSEREHSRLCLLMDVAKGQVARADLHRIALNQAIARDAHPIHKRASGRAAVLDFIVAISEQADGFVQAAKRPVFPGKIAIPAAPPRPLFLS